MNLSLLFKLKLNYYFDVRMIVCLLFAIRVMIFLHLNRQEMSEKSIFET